MLVDQMHRKNGEIIDMYVPHTGKDTSWKQELLSRSDIDEGI